MKLGWQLKNHNQRPALESFNDNQTACPLQSSQTIIPISCLLIPYLLGPLRPSVIVKTSGTFICSSKVDRRQIPDPRPILLVGRFISLGYLSYLFTLFV